MPSRELEKFEAAMAVVQQRRLRRDWLATAEERLVRFERLQVAVLETLHSNPQACEAFHRRNMHQRRQSRVRQLEIQMRKPGLPAADDIQHG
jgi:hypothetical protein